jgi:hypothetical protein
MGREARKVTENAVGIIVTFDLDLTLADTRAAAALALGRSTVGFRLGLT